MNAYDFIAEQAKLKFGDVEGVDIDLQNNFFKLYIEDKIVIRFKKLNRHWLAQTSNTEQSCDWFLNLPISGIRNHCQRITVGYRTDTLGDVSQILLTRQHGRKVLLWSHPIGLELMGCKPTPDLENETSTFDEVPIVVLDPKGKSNSANAAGA